MTKKTKPLVTIVTITFNLIKEGREKYFRQCVESVHSQTYANIEHIIIDGASTDGSVDLMKEYAKKGWIKYNSEPDTGIYNAMNKGVKIAKGKYIAFLNSDDFYHNTDAVSLLTEAMEKDLADFSYANFIVSGEKETYIEKGEIEKFIYTMPFGHPTMFTKTSVIRTEGGFDEGLKLPADYDLIIRIILKGYKSVYVDSEIATYRLGGLGSTNDHSDEITKIYLKNYSTFYDFVDSEQARKIMYEQVVPEGFPSKFKKYAAKQELNNIDIKKVVSDLETKVSKDSPIRHQEGNIPVFLSSDNNYSPFVATTILSIMDNTKSFVEFYILDGGIYEENKDKIRNIKQKFSNLSIEFIKIDTEKEFKNFPTRIHFSIDMYTRYLIPKLKPKLDKVIYSDVDVIFNGDIAELYKEDLDGFIIGAVPYTFGYLNPDNGQIVDFHERLKLSGKHEYFESGLLLLDCRQWREKNITKKLLKKVEECGAEVLLTPDQDALNIVFENKYKQLDHKYIVVPHRTRIMLASEKTSNSARNPFIYHYAGPDKPWDNPDIEFAEYFWQYAKKTLFYKQLRFNLKEMIRLKNKEFAQRKAVIFSPQGFLIKYWFNLQIFILKSWCKFLDSPVSRPAIKIRHWMCVMKLSNK